MSECSWVSRLFVSHSLVSLEGNATGLEATAAVGKGQGRGTVGKWFWFQRCFGFSGALSLALSLSLSLSLFFLLLSLVNFCFAVLGVLRCFRVSCARNRRFVVTSFEFLLASVGF